MKNLSKGMLMAALITGTLAAGTVYAAEAPEMESFTLDPVVVTSQRMETRDLETPANVEVVDSKKIEAAGYKNAFDVIEHQLGLSSTGYGDAGQDFGFSSGRTVIRGYDRGTLVMVDGIPMNLKNYNSLDGIPVEMIEKVEIIKGAAGTLYGAEAMGGVVNIITKRPGEGKTSLKVKGTYGNFYKDYGVNVASEKLILNLQREFSDKFDRSNDYPRGSATNWWIGKGQKNRAAVSANITDEINFNLMYEEDDITRGGIKPGTKPTLYDYRYKGKRMTTGLRYAGKENGVVATLGYNYRDVDGYDFVKNAGVDSSAHLKGYIADVQKKWDIGKNSLIAGYSFKREDYKGTVKKDQIDHRNSNSIYLSYNHNFTDKFSTTIGLRGEAISDSIKDQKVLNPQFQTLYKIDDTTSWYINVGRAFQMPTVDSVFKNKNFNGDTLKPERGWTYETGIKKMLGSDSILKASVYKMRFDNKFGWGKDPITNDNIPINAGYFKNTGFEVSYEQNLSKAWNYSLGIGFGNPSVKAPTAKVWTQDSGRIDAAASVFYSMDKLRSGLTFKYLGNREVYSGLQVPFRARLSWNTSYDITKRDTVTLTLNNLLSRDNYANKYGNLDLPYNWRIMYSHTF